MKCGKEDCKGTTFLIQTKLDAVIWCNECSWNMRVKENKDETIKYFIDNGGRVEDGS